MLEQLLERIQVEPRTLGIGVAASRLVRKTDQMLTGSVAMESEQVSQESEQASQESEQASQESEQVSQESEQASQEPMGVRHSKTRLAKPARAKVSQQEVDSITRPGRRRQAVVERSNLL